MLDLEEIIKNKILKLGSISLMEFLTLVLYHHEKGYYSKSNIIGKKGDFITAPEVSQVFGEMIANFIALNAKKIVEYKDLCLTELGPGKGTLMKDILRTLKKIDEKLYQKLQDVYFLEQTKAFKNVLEKKFMTASFLNNIIDLPNSHNIIIANEFFDALPQNQYVYKNKAWREKRITLDKNNNFRFYLSEKKILKNKFFPEEAKENEVFEFSQQLANILLYIFKRINLHGGILLIIDYCKNKESTSGTLKTILKHKHVDLFFSLGESDISFSVDLEIIRRLAEEENCLTFGPAEQGIFLSNLGINERFKNLIMYNPEREEELTHQKNMLISRENMGEVFKVFAVTSKNYNNLYGFA